MSPQRSLSGPALREALGVVCDRVGAAQDELCRLDGMAGDGDLGFTLASGFSAVREVLSDLDETEPGVVLIRVGRELARRAPSTMGTLLATVFLRAGAAVKGRTELDSGDIATMLFAGAAAVEERGKVSVGQRTFLDALHPSAVAAKDGADRGLDVAHTLRAAASAAREGAAATADMEPQVGRAGWIPDRARGTVDAGAVAWATIITALSDAVASENGDRSER